MNEKNSLRLQVCTSYIKHEAYIKRTVCKEILSILFRRILVTELYINGRTLYCLASFKDIMYVCMYVFMYDYIYVLFVCRVCIYVCIDVCMYVCIHVCMYVCMHA